MEKSIVIISIDLKIINYIKFSKANLYFYIMFYQKILQ